MMRIMPAPRGTGLTIEQKCRLMLALAGITDVYSRTEGTTATKINLFMACFSALQQLAKTKIQPVFKEDAGLVEGAR